jgi:hypothetical protein
MHSVVCAPSLFSFSSILPLFWTGEFLGSPVDSPWGIALKVFACADDDHDDICGRALSVIK